MKKQQNKTYLLLNNARRPHSGAEDVSLFRHVIIQRETVDVVEEVLRTVEKLELRTPCECRLHRRVGPQRLYQRARCLCENNIHLKITLNLLSIQS